MENTNNNQKSTAKFFGTENPSIQADAAYLDNLKDEVLQKYINFYSESKMDTSKTPNLLRYGLAFLGIFVIFSAFLATTFLNNDKENDSNNPNLGAEVAFFEGNVEYKYGTSDWDVVQTGTAIEEGYEIRVTGVGKAIVNLDDGSAVRLDSDTEVAFASLDPKNISIRNQNGQVYTRVVKSDRAFNVLVDDVEFVSLGTAYKTINKSDVKGVEVYQSKVSVKGAEANDITVDEGNKYYLKNSVTPTEEKKVAQINVAELKNDSFTTWNKEQDKMNNDFSKDLGILKDANVETPVQNEDGTITATATTVEGGIKITWTTANTAAPKGFKVLKSWTENPTFGIDAAEYVSDPNAREYTFTMKDGKTYHFRVCEYTGEGCINYSNNASAVAQVASEPTPTPQPTGGAISLGGHANGGTVSLNWTVTNLDVSQGFKVVYSKTSATPTYGVDGAEYHGAESRSAQLSMPEGKTIYFRVCRYTGNGCDNYSNTMTITTGAAQQKPQDVPVSSGVTGISLAAAGNKVSWTVAGTAKSGVKLTYSKVSGPTYPGRGGDRAVYYENTGAMTSYELDAFDGAGSYYVRVCEYLNGSCGVYSNEVMVNL